MAHAPRLTDAILDGLGTALAAATAGGPADIGIPDNGSEEEVARGEAEWERVERARDWVQAMQAHRAGRPHNDPAARLPAAVRRGLVVAMDFAEADVENDDAEQLPHLDAQQRRDFLAAVAWVDSLPH